MVRNRLLVALREDHSFRRAIIGLIGSENEALNKWQEQDVKHEYSPVIVAIGIFPYYLY